MKIEKLYELFLASDGISTDTRKLVPNTLFFALRGDNFNGNQFAQQALDEGCSYAIVDEPQSVQSDRFIQVESVLKTLQDLARHHRRQFNIPVLGITGSNGKTTTKELIGAVLSTTFNTLVTEGNLNNHLGVPFTLLRLNMDHEIAVIEMGASKPGDIQELAEIAEPTHGIITNIGAAHIEGFGSLQGVIQTKTELYRFIASTGGTLFCNRQDETLKSRLPENTPVSFYGDEQGITGHVTSLDPFVHFQWEQGDYVSPYLKTNLVGQYNFFNFLAAVCIGRFFEVPAEKINQALQEYVPSNKRSQVEKTERNTLIVDCYNANATSMRAALESFSAMQHDHKLAVLGDMLELGSISTEEHQKVADYVEKLESEAVLVGGEFQKIWTSLPRFKTVDDLIESGLLGKQKNRLILIKGSRGIRLEKAVEHL